MPGRLIIANLDCEQDYANPRAPRLLPDAVRARISAAGTLMAALGRAGDVLYTPRPVPTGRALLADERGLRMRCGALPEPGQFDEILAWGETWTVARLRSAEPTDRQRGAGRPDDEDDDEDDALAAALWRHRPSPAIARRCNDRRYAFALNDELGLLLPGAFVIDSLAELEAHLRAGGHQHGHSPTADGDPGGRTWVLEAPFSASGRFRLRRRGAQLDPSAHTRARRLLDTFKQLIFQPWVERVIDVGSAGLITDGLTGAWEWTLIGQHLLETDRAGVFRGIVLSSDPAAPLLDMLASDVRSVGERALAASRECMDQVARKLADDGYRGPFGIDGFGYRDPGGALHTYPICEINARVTFGLLAHELARQDGRGRCRLGLGPVPSGVTAKVLLDTGDARTGDGVSAWLADC